MANEFQKLSGDYQRTGKEAISSMLRSAGDYRKSLEEISFEWRSSPRDPSAKQLRRRLN